MHASFATLRVSADPRALKGPTHARIHGRRTTARLRKFCVRVHTQRFHQARSSTSSMNTLVGALFLHVRKQWYMCHRWRARKSSVLTHVFMEDAVEDALERVFGVEDAVEDARHLGLAWKTLSFIQTER